MCSCIHVCMHHSICAYQYEYVYTSQAMPAAYLRRVELRHDVARAAAAALGAARGLVPRTTVPERCSLRWLQAAQAGLGDAGRATWLGRSSPLYSP